MKAEALSQVIHNIQQERGYSLGYLLSGGAEETAELFSQREQTDKALFGLNQQLARQKSKLKAAKELEEIPLMRHAVNTLRANPDSIRAAFGQVNSALIEEVARTVLYSRNPEIKNHLHAHLFMLHGKEHFAMLRSILKQALLAGGFRGNGFAEFAALKGKHEVNMERFRESVSDDLAAYYTRKMEDPSAFRVENMLQAVYHQDPALRIPFSKDEWWVNGVSYLNLLKEIEDYSVLATRQAAESQLAAISGALTRHILLAGAIVLEFTVNVTEMFRDPLFYKSLREKVLKHLATYPFLKIWVAGCSTGEEVYSVAILLEEGLLERSVIYATDINQKVLQAAKEGLYRMDLMQAYTANYQKAGGKHTFSDYYTAKYDAVLLDKCLKQQGVFSIHNLAVDGSFNEFQLILCRNVLIYFNQSLQNKVINLFHDSLSPFGFLALGNKESLLFSDKQKAFAEVDKKEKIYRKENKSLLTTL